MKKNTVLLSYILLLIGFTALRTMILPTKNKLPDLVAANIAANSKTQVLEDDMDTRLKLIKQQRQIWIKEQKSSDANKKTSSPSPVLADTAPALPSMPISPAQVPTPPPSSARLIDKLKNLGGSKQVILVQASSFQTFHVTINTYELINGKWQEILTNIPGVIGKNGFSLDRHEGDYTSPVGKFGFITFFGWNGNPGFKMPFRPASSIDYWVSGSNPEEYNTWIQYSGDPEVRFGHSNYENLGTQPLYKYAAALDYNYGPNKVVGKGSAIFLHISSSSGGATAGCTAMPEDKLLKVLMWMDPSKNPVIIQGPLTELNKM